MSRPVFLSLIFFLFTAAGACVPPQSPAERLSFSAHELNAATRFGRIDVALAHVNHAAQASFLRRRRPWGEGIRIVDVEMKGIRVNDDDNATVSVAVSWHRLDETTLRVSRIEQKWTQGVNDWILVEEQRVAGAPGIFAPPPKSKPPKD
jgi:hypothetical protein